MKKVKKYSDRSAWSSSSILTSILSKSLIIKKNSAMWDLIGVPSCMRRIKRRCFRINRFTNLQIVVLKSLPQRVAVFSVENSSNALSAKQNWIAVEAFSSNSCQVSFFMSWGFFSLLSSAFFNLLWVRIAFILICHLLKLMTHQTFKYWTWS